MTRVQRAYFDCLSAVSMATVAALGAVGVALALGMFVTTSVAELYIRFLWFIATWTLLGILVVLTTALNDVVKGIR